MSIEPAAFALAVHGGAGTIRRERTSKAARAAYHAGLCRALLAGGAVLAGGGRALDAVAAAVVALEDDPLFNAGRGASLTAAGTFEMDAAIMDGRDRRAGAVAAVFGPKNPVTAARAVMDASPHVLLVAEGAAAFCRARGLAFAEPQYFETEARRREWREGMERRRAPGGHGTVGAVARDCDGNLAAATSTGGIAGKVPGRVGDSPLVGAGTFADNRTCAVSATGHGEFFIRWGVAFEVAARLAHLGQTLDRAAAAVIAELAAQGGEGGLVAIDRDGRLALPFNTPGMYRGYLKSGGAPHTAIWDEPYCVSRS
ncbi:MAG TPA: isoaspartyl peptidase/L-asparaginase [Stellaceae bacterium]|nr:isoaspartyl peptidase/L-asparaginase [Stellaceae bacterium]